MFHLLFNRAEYNFHKFPVNMVFIYENISLVVGSSLFIKIIII